MKIATFNINGIKARINALPEWLDEAQPDVVLMQEIKSVDEAFPTEVFEERGYNVEVHGQKSFNGVGILSKLPLEDVTRGLPGDDADEQARYIEATVVGEAHSVRLCGLYLPNGNPVELEEDGTPVAGGKYAYKLGWMDRLRARAQELLAEETPFLMAGDYNIIPQPEDAANPKSWEGDALYRPESHAKWRALLNLGLATTAFGIIRRARGTATTASASITSCCAPIRRIACANARSTRTCAGGTSPPITSPSGLIWTFKPPVFRRRFSCG
jgi:exodeoxyribonuclease-3